LALVLAPLGMRVFISLFFVLLERVSLRVPSFPVCLRVWFLSHYLLLCVGVLSPIILLLKPVAARAASVRAVGINFYVSNSGNDDNQKNTCKGTTSPCKTLGQAIDQAISLFNVNNDDNVFNIHVASGTYSGQGNVGLTFGLDNSSPMSFNLFPMDEKNDVTIDLSADANEGKAVTANWAIVPQAVMLTVHQFTFQGASENAIFSGSPQSTINIFDSMYVDASSISACPCFSVSPPC